MAAESPQHGTTVVTLPPQFGPYRVIRRLGRGGMGVVFLAEDTRLSRKVAIKICSVNTDNPVALNRFQREATSAASLRHPNLCPVYEFDVRDGIPYLAMAYIDGPTLGEWAAGRGSLEPRTAAALVAKLAVGMRAAHARGVVHRDLKPGNILLDKGEPVIVDFGLARQEGGDVHLTQKGAILGTPSYMSPEQVAAEGPIGPQSDIYALGVILYELLTGRCPFTGAQGVVMANILYQPTPPPRTHRPDLDPGLEAVCLKAMAKSTKDRYATMGDLAKALAPFAKGAPPATSPKGAAPHRLPRIAAPDTDAVLPPTLPTTPLRGPMPFKKAKSGAALHIFLLLLCLGALAAVISIPWWKSRQPDPVASRPDDTPPPEKETPPKTDDAKKPSEPEPVFTNTVGMKMVLVKPGRFEMGSPVSDNERFPEELLHTVRLTRPYYLGACEVTQQQFERVMGKDRNPSAFTAAKGGGPDRPVDSVTWEEAVDFCKRLSALEKRDYRLPTEAEWEYGCRAHTTGPFNFAGTTGLKTHGWFKDNSANKTQPVGRKTANAYGLFDMHGNVSEWCADVYDKDFYRRSPQNDPQCTGVGDRVVRGGSWSSTARNCRSANRTGAKSDTRYNNIGFRVALSVPASFSVTRKWLDK